MNKEHHNIQQDVMSAIRKGEVRMRPRWHFALLSLLSLVGAAIVFLTLLYTSSLAVYFLRESGALFVPSFGARGWSTLAYTTPWTLLLLIAAFVFVLELLVRRYAFVYKKPLLISMLSIAALVVLGGFFVGQTPLHREIRTFAEHGDIPAFVGTVYGPALRGAPPPDMFRGEIVKAEKGMFVILDEGGSGTTSIILTARTRLPHGEDFREKDRIVVVGDVVATGTVRAFGIRELENLSEQRNEIRSPRGL